MISDIDNGFGERHVLLPHYCFHEPAPKVAVLGLPNEVKRHKVNIETQTVFSVLSSA